MNSFGNTWDDGEIIRRLIEGAAESHFESVKSALYGAIDSYLKIGEVKSRALDYGCGLFFFSVHLVEYVRKIERESQGQKFHGFLNKLPANGTAYNVNQWMPYYLRTPDWYQKMFEDAGMTQVDCALFEDKYYMAWFMKSWKI